MCPRFIRRSYKWIFLFKSVKFKRRTLAKLSLKAIIVKMQHLKLLLKNLEVFFQTNFSFAVIVVLFAFVLFFIFGVGIGRFVEKLQANKKIKTERLDALKKSRSVLKGQIYEQLSPYFPDFPINPKSLKFLGSPVDYVAFIGSENNPEIVEKIIFLEIKTGNSKLTTTEKSIKKAISEKQVEFVEYYLE